MNIIIIGAGGHAHVVAEILSRMKEVDNSINPIGFLDDDTRLHGTIILGFPVIGSLKKVENGNYDAFVVAIGNNQIRQKIFVNVAKYVVQSIIAYHPKSTIAPDVVVGRGTMICAGVIVNTGTKIGMNNILNTGCTIDHHNIIGSHAHIAPGVHLGGNVTIGDGSLIGIGSVVLPGVRIGENCVIGAGAVVHKDVAAGLTVIGNPAKPLI